MRGKRSQHDETYRRLHADGLSCRRIAQQCGVSTSAVSQWLRARKLSPNGTGNIPAERKAKQPEGLETRVVAWLPGYSFGSDGVVYSERGNTPLAIATRGHDAGPRVVLSVSGRARHYYVAALVAEAWHGARPDGAVVRWRDGNKSNCAPDNVFWGFPATNIDRAEFVETWQTSHTVREVAEKLGMSYQHALKLADFLRQRGVPLRDIRAAREDNYDELRKIAEQFGGGQTES